MERRGPGRPARRGQDHAGAAGSGAGAVGEGEEAPRAGAAPARRPRRGRAHGGDLGRGGRCDGGLSRPLRFQGFAGNPHRGRDRRHLHAHGPRRSLARGRRRHPVRRVPRALARRRSRPRARPRRTAGAARGSQAAGDVGDARRRTRRPAARRRARNRKSDRERRPRLPGRDEVYRTEYTRTDRTAGRRDDRARIAGRCRLVAGLSSRRRRDPAHRDIPARTDLRSIDRHRRALWRARSRRPGPGDCAARARPAQGRARDLDRGNLAHDRRRARGDRLRAGAGAALRARRGFDQARDRTGFARLGRPAAWPRRAHRARHLLSAVGRAADRVARSRQQAGNAGRRSVGLRARPRLLGRCRPGIARLPRSAAAAGARGSQGAARRARGDRPRGTHHGGGEAAAKPAAAAAPGAHGGRCGGRGRSRRLPPRSRWC